MTVQTRSRRRRGARFKSVPGWVHSVHGALLLPNERVVLGVYAEAGDYHTGLNCWPSRATVAELSGLSLGAVDDALKALKETHRLLRVDVSPEPLDYQAWRGDRRPVRYEVVMPYSAWHPEALERANARRAAVGAPLITPDTHPDPPPPPPRPVRADEGRPAPQRGRKHTRAAAALEGLAAEYGTTPARLAAALDATLSTLPDVLGVPAEDVAGPVAAALGMTVPAAAVEPLEAAPAPVDDEAGEGQRGVSQTRDGVSQKPARGVSETHNHASASPGGLDDQVNASPAVGGQLTVVRGPASPARAGATSKRDRGQATPRRPRRKIVEYTVSRDAVGVYVAAIPPAVKARIPAHAVARILHAITGELERQAAHLGCHDPAELARRIAERAEGWRWRMVDARDPVAVVIGAIVRGGAESPATAVAWCGRCEGPTPARRYVTLDDGRLAHCPDCHPSAHREVAA